MFAIIYISITFFSFILFLSINFKKSDKWIILLVAFSFGILAFSLTSKSGLFTDKVRFDQTMDTIKYQAIKFGYKDGWNYLLNEEGYNSTPIAGVLVYISAIINKRLLYFIVAFTDFYISLSWIYRFALNKKSKIIMAFGSLTFMCIYIFSASVSGVRTNLAGAMAIYTIYLHLTNQLNIFKTYLILLVATLIHPSMLIFWGLDLIVTLFGKVPWMRRIIYILLLGENFFQNSLFNIFKSLSFIPFFASISFKTTQYFRDNAYIVSYSSIVSGFRHIYALSY